MPESPDTQVMVNQAAVEIADVAASNGVIHAIDQVIVPIELMDAAKSKAPAAPSTPKPALDKPGNSDKLPQ
ncbi:fasciclin domain-containing protein [filamentous cyanobacterium LEGE 11480]|uniref:Fasciclin domain-containing protein n=2 Tax=Romeriopsis TaxID=2992131 RepID=A0A928Z5M6_9CYAN|nr:fasciclin domain-containing protein [Romeriopsis navalis LEGE 11480]